MGSQTLVYEAKLRHLLKEIDTHLLRVNIAFSELAARHEIPFNIASFTRLLSNNMDVAFADQVIYRFSKAQDSMGAKLFKAFLLYQGENIDKPFLDILNSLEKLNVVNVDDWFELREIRNEIAHDYDKNALLAMNIMNHIYQHRGQLSHILTRLRQLSHIEETSHE
jgi:uncharacterized protein with HEPN domain